MLKREKRGERGRERGERGGNGVREKTHTILSE